MVVYRRAGSLLESKSLIYTYVALSPWALDYGHSPDQLVASEASAGLGPVMAHTIFLEKGDVLQGEFGQLLDSLKIGSGWWW